mmetsp:Transcript_31901/g.48927  ORF Transcript_31901/g.48927 Transcript_31901/m.48927 type:complete len:147 (+) Transcript_31901:161-601(+)|eukprot:CAMPEP_0195266030 /NCGR_PEP_ID=MMETSP0706-20130129/11774_1 /TAXON_ID=33640 /ORGANISM="Asterionellopsis glacialis, Strain CCMP134" /LENGTH=146 /DNA_ID=CAMNT_0040320557 /DNA_START=99 /DNA_END=539 /DNA_ORIENTATION=-
MFGSGAPDWKGGDTSNTSSGNSAGLNNRYNSYQKGSGPGSYQPPGQVYADKQTDVLHDTVKTQYATEGTAATVMNQLQQQRQQIQGAHDDLWETKETTEVAKRELADLAAKNRKKKQRLYFIIAVLSTTDLLLFLRIAKCRGSFFC